MPPESKIVAKVIGYHIRHFLRGIRLCPDVNMERKRSRSKTGWSFADIKAANTQHLCGFDHYYCSDEFT